MFILGEIRHMITGNYIAGPGGKAIAETAKFVWDGDRWVRMDTDEGNAVINKVIATNSHK